MANKSVQWCVALGAALLLGPTHIAPLCAEEQQDGNVFDPKPYAQGDMEIGAGLGFGGASDYFSLAVAGNYAYYVIPRLAPGIDLQYTVIWGDLEYPQSITVLPFLKYVLIRSHSFAPFLILTGGRDFQWGGTTDPLKGFAPVNAWILGGGGGAQIGVSRHFAIRVSLLALYYFYDETVRVVGESDPTDRKLYFPVISLGLLYNL